MQSQLIQAFRKAWRYIHVSESGHAYMNFGEYRPGGNKGVGVFNGEGKSLPEQSKK